MKAGGSPDRSSARDGAAYGDTLANLFAATGWQVQREYYINDAGRQVDILALSVWLRYLEAGGEQISFPKRGYPAEYIRVSAEKLRLQHGARWQLRADEPGNCGHCRHGSNACCGVVRVI